MNRTPGVLTKDISKVASSLIWIKVNLMHAHNYCEKKSFGLIWCTDQSKTRNVDEALNIPVIGP